MAKENFVDTITRLAQAGDPEAQYSLGLILDQGQGVKRDPAQAITWMTRACAQDVAGACLFLGIKTEFGNGVARDRDKAAALYRKAASRNWPMAQFLLASLLAQGETTENRLRAVFWFLAAADQGYPEADREAAKMIACFSKEDKERFDRLRRQIERKTGIRLSSTP